MSAGEFIDSKYQDGKGNIYSCKIQEETAELVLNSVTNAPPTGNATMPVAARMTGSRRRYGCRARSVRIKFTDAVPDGYKVDQVIELPILTPAAYNGMSAIQKPTGTYLELPVQALGFTEEKVR